MTTVTLTVNGHLITAPEGRKLLWAALDNGIYIPNLCGLRDNSEPLTACRLCFVEIEGRTNGPVTACTEPVAEGMVVTTTGERTLRLVKRGFELLMASHNQDCRHCLKNRACELQKIARHLKTGLRPRGLRRLPRPFEIDDSHPLFTYDPGKCVLCGRCVWTCRKLGKGILGYSHRGFDRRVTTFWDEPIAVSGAGIPARAGSTHCGDCLECVHVCPTGAMVPRPQVATTGHRETLV
jgi:formate dehydrogenase major subunit/NADH-quinone oxidoreductase subunit G